MNTWFTTALTIALVSAFMEKLNKEAKAISQATPGTYTMPKSIVWLGGICTVFFAVCTVLSMVAGVAGRRVVFVPFCGLGIFLSLYAINRRFVVTAQYVYYTNIFKRETAYPLTDITLIKQGVGGDFICYVNGKKAFTIDQQFPDLLELIDTCAEENGNNIEIQWRKNKK